MDTIKIFNYDTYITEWEREMALYVNFFLHPWTLVKWGPSLKHRVLLRQLLESLASRSTKPAPVAIQETAVYTGRGDSPHAEGGGLLVLFCSGVSGNSRTAASAATKAKAPSEGSSSCSRVYVGWVGSLSSLNCA